MRRAKLGSISVAKKAAEERHEEEEEREEHRHLVAAHGAREGLDGGAERRRAAPAHDAPPAAALAVEDGVRGGREALEVVDEGRAVAGGLGAREIGADVAVERRELGDLLGHEYLQPAALDGADQGVELVPVALPAPDEGPLREGRD